MSALIALVAGLGMGLASVPHCAAMCSPVAALACSCRPSTLGAALRYQFGRSATYTLLGSLAGYGGAALGAALREPWMALALSFALAFALVATAWRLWARAAVATTSGAVSLRRKPSSTGAHSAWLAVGIGLGSGLLPCGAFGMMLMAAAGAASPLAGAALGLGFVTSSAVGVLGAGGIAGWFSRVARPRTRKACAVALVAAAGLVVARAWPSEAQSCPHHSAVGWRLHAGHESQPRVGVGDRGGETAKTALWAEPWALNQRA